MPPHPKMSPWYIDYFELRTLERQSIQGEAFPELPLCIEGSYNLWSKQRHFSEQDEMLLIICLDGGINLTFLGKWECMTTLPTWILVAWNPPAVITTFIFSSRSLQVWSVFLTHRPPQVDPLPLFTWSWLGCETGRGCFLSRETPTVAFHFGCLFVS